MRGNVIIITKLFTVFLINLSAEPYKPYPILFIHGVRADSRGCWGAGVDTLADGETPSDWVTSWESTYSQFLDYMHLYVDVWWEFDETYTKPGNPAYPNKTFVEIINFNDNRGSIDPDYPVEYSGQGDELWHRINEVMYEYYGEGWQSNRNAKIILVSDSTGSLMVGKLQFYSLSFARV